MGWLCADIEPLAGDASPGGARAATAGPDEAGNSADARLNRRSGAAAIFSLVTAAMLLSGAVAVRAAEEPGEDVYQIVKATHNRVWRLNKRTGEIAVCTLDGQALICTSSTEAIKPPAMTFEQRQAEKRQAEAEAAKRREEQKAKDLAFIDRVFAAIKSLMRAAIERDDSGEDVRK